MDKNTIIQLSKSVYCLLGHTNVGIIVDDSKIILVDSGLNSENASEIDKLIQNNFNKKISAIINTHSNADHAGGNKFFSEKYNCKIYATSKEAAFLENPYLESAIIWGAHPFDKIRTSYFECEKSIATDLVNEKSQIKLNNGTIIKFISLPGHFIDMIGILITDIDKKNTIFLGDSIFGAQMIVKYSISYILNISEFIKTLLKVYHEQTGLETYCKAIGGGTYVHDIEGGVAFGAEFPGDVNNMHGNDESITLESLRMNTKIIANAIYEICK